MKRTSQWNQSTALHADCKSILLSIITHSYQDVVLISTMQDQKFIVWIKSRGDYQCLMAYRRIYLFSTVSGFIYLSSYYYEGESAGGWGIHVNLFRRGGWRKLERKRSCRFANRPLKAGACGACSWDWLLPLPILGMCLDAKIKIPNFFSGTCMET